MDRAAGESILKAVPPATLELALGAHEGSGSQRLAQDPQHCAGAQVVAHDPFCYSGASLSLMGGWDPCRYPRSPALIWLLGEYSSKETEAQWERSILGLQIGTVEARLCSLLPHGWMTG